MRSNMKVVALFLLFAPSVFAQNNAGAAYSCGPPNVQFDVKKDNSQHSIGQPEAGKALVYVIEVFQRPPGELGIQLEAPLGPAFANQFHRGSWQNLFLQSSNTRTNEFGWR